MNLKQAIYFREIKTRSHIAFFVLALGASARWVHDAASNGMDLHVYWQAVRLWLSAQNPYAYTPADQGFVFKYPPWSLPAFLPFAAVSEPVARILWALFLIFSVIYAIRWVIRAGASLRAAVISALALWWIWLAHASSGQFTILLLTASLWACAPQDDSNAFPSRGRSNSWKTSLLAYFLSFKIFPLIQVFGIYKRFFRLRTLTLFLCLLLSTSMTTLLVLQYPISIKSISELLQNWSKAAASGATELPFEVIRGRDNLGFTALVARTFSIPVTHTQWDTAIATLLGIGFGSAWDYFSKKLPFSDRWAGWIGVGLVIQPLAWNHSFVLAYPLCALSLARAFDTKIPSRRYRLARFLSSLGVICVGLMVWQIWGMALIRPLELFSIKSWGVLLCASALVLTSLEDPK